MPRTNNQGPSPNTHNKEKMTRMGVLGHLHTWTSSLPTREVLSDTPSFPLHAARVFQRGPGKATAIGVPRRHTTRLGLLAGLGPVCSCGPRRESKFSSNEKGKRHKGVSTTNSGTLSLGLWLTPLLPHFSKGLTPRVFKECQNVESEAKRKLLFS